MSYYSYKQVFVKKMSDQKTVLYLGVFYDTIFVTNIIAIMCLVSNRSALYLFLLWSTLGWKQY